jgi:hypothetical protein
MDLIRVTNDISHAMSLNNVNDPFSSRANIPTTLKFFVKTRCKLFTATSGNPVANYLIVVS